FGPLSASRHASGWRAQALGGVQLSGDEPARRRSLLLGMNMSSQVPPYFDALIDGFRRGQVGRQVHLGYWDEPPSLDTPPQPGECEQAQQRLDEIMLGLADLHDGLAVLDIGCGFGGTLEAVNRSLTNMRLVGVNIDARQLDICRDLRPRAGNRFDWL